jgi:hypothetical protein
MAWRVESVMDQRLCFITACLRADAPMSGLCLRFEISRKTGYTGRSRQPGRSGRPTGALLRIPPRRDRRAGRSRTTRFSAQCASLRRTCCRHCWCRRLRHHDHDCARNGVWHGAQLIPVDHRAQYWIDTQIVRVGKAMAFRAQIRCETSARIVPKGVRVSATAPYFTNYVARFSVMCRR